MREHPKFSSQNSRTAESTSPNVYPFSSFIHSTPRGSWIRVAVAGNHRHTRDAHAQPTSNLRVRVNIDFKECATSTIPVAPVGVTRCVQGVGKWLLDRGAVGRFPAREMEPRHRTLMNMNKDNNSPAVMT